MRWLLVALCCLLPPVAHAQSVTLLDCGTVRFFGEPCEPDAPALPQPTPAPPTPPPPLFTRETMAPDTPPLLVTLMQAPSPENARAFLAFQKAKLARLTEVQHLLKTIGQEDAHAHH